MTVKGSLHLHRILTVIVCFLTLVTFGLIGYNWYLTHTLAHAVLGPALDYGDQISSNKLRVALGQVGYGGKLDSHTHLLLYFFRPGHLQHLKSVKYGEVLRQRHGENGLQVLGVTDAPPREVQALRNSLSLPVLYDKDAMLKLLLHVPEPYEHTFLLTSAGHVVFSQEGAPQEDLIRQIVEKYVIGKIDYTRLQADQLYRVGEQLPTMRVTPIGGGLERVLVPRDAEVVLISARCTSCQLNAYIERYRTLASSDDTLTSHLVFFSRRFPREDILRTLETHNISPKNFYVSVETLDDVENEYHTKTGDESAVKVSVDREGRITTVKSLDATN